MHVIDLTHAYGNDMPRYPGMPEPCFLEIATLAHDGHAMTDLHFTNHLGTHVDAPAHLVPGPTLDEVSLARFVTQAVVLDFSTAPRGPISREAIEAHLSAIQPGDTVLLFSGGARWWGTEAYWQGWCYPDQEAAQALLTRQISAIGFDGPSADPVGTQTFALHRTWLSAGCLILENLTNLERLPPAPARFSLIIAPLKLRRANGAPARIFALLEENTLWRDPVQTHGWAVVPSWKHLL